MLGFFETYNAAGLRHLYGGRIRGNDYFIAIVVEGKIEELFFGRLINNRKTQKQPIRHPDGYLPFDIGGEDWDFDLHTETFSVKRLTCCKGFQGKPMVYRSGCPLRAVVLKTPASTSEALLVAQQLWRRTWLREQVRRACTEQATLTVVTELLQESWLGKRPAVPALLEATRWFEFYLSQAGEQTLTDLVAALHPKKLAAQAA